MVADDNDVGVGVKFLVSPRGDVAHGDKGSAGERCGRRLPWLSDVEDERFVGSFQLVD